MEQKWEYTVVPLHISVRDGDPAASMKISNEFQTMVNDRAVRGWEYNSFEVLPVTVRAGCIGTFFGGRPTTANYWCVVFRREVPAAVSLKRQPAQPKPGALLPPLPQPTPSRSQQVERFYYQGLDGEAAGPVTSPQLKQLFDDSVIGLDTLVCQEGAESWQRLEEIMPP